MMWPLWKRVWQFLKKLSIKLLYYPPIPLLSIYPREIKTYTHTKTCIQKFTVELFVIAKM